MEKQKTDESGENNKHELVWYATNVKDTGDEMWQEVYSKNVISAFWNKLYMWFVAGRSRRSSEDNSIRITSAEKGLNWNRISMVSAISASITHFDPWKTGQFSLLFRASLIIGIVINT